MIDERFNGGGAEAEYVVDYLGRRLLSYWVTREGQGSCHPAAAPYCSFCFARASRRSMATSMTDCNSRL